MRLTDQVTLNFNNKISTAAVFLDIEKAFYMTWHSGLLYKLSKLEFWTSLIKLIGSFVSQRNVNAKGNASRDTTSFYLVPYSFQYVYSDALQTHAVHLAFYADDTCRYATECKKDIHIRNF
jgi:hypothetical protein